MGRTLVLLLALYGIGRYVGNETKQVEKNEPVHHAANRLQITAHEDGFRVVHPEIPSEIIRLQIPERYARGGATPYGLDHLSALDFTPYKNGGWRYEKNIRTGGTLSIELVPKVDSLDFEIRVKNTKSDSSYEGTFWTICAEFLEAPLFGEPRESFPSRASVLINDRRIPVAQTHRKGGGSITPLMPVYTTKNIRSHPAWQKIVENGYGWGLSDSVVDDNSVQVESASGDWYVQLVTDREINASVNSVKKREWYYPVESDSEFINKDGAPVTGAEYERRKDAGIKKKIRKRSYHRCIHSNAIIKKFQPGTARVIKGRLEIKQHPTPTT